MYKVCVFGGGGGKVRFADIISFFISLENEIIWSH